MLRDAFLIWLSERQILISLACRRSMNGSTPLRIIILLYTLSLLLQHVPEQKIAGDRWIFNTPLYLYVYVFSTQSMCHNKDFSHTRFFSPQSMFSDAGVRVDGYMGSVNPVGGFAAVDVAVCTIEKANSLINRLMEEGGIDMLGECWQTCCMKLLYSVWVSNIPELASSRAVLNWDPKRLTHINLAVN